MVKGISRQVIVVQSPDPQLFDQAIFILKDSVVGKRGITDEMLLREARCLIRNGGAKRKKLWYYGPAWAALGAAGMAVIWFITTVL